MRWEIVELLRPIEAPLKRPIVITFRMTACKSSLAIINGKGDKGSHWRRPLHISNSVVGEPLEYLHNNFFIGGDLEEKKMTWVA